MRKVIFAVVISTSCIGCGFINPGSRGHFALITDSEGLESFGRMQSGLITNGKASPNKNTPYWDTEKKRSDNETQVSLKPSFLDNLMGGK